MDENSYNQGTSWSQYLHTKGSLEWRSSFSGLGSQGQKVLLSTMSSPEAMSNRRVQISKILSDDLKSDKSQSQNCDVDDLSSKAMLKWSATGSLPIIVTSGENLVPRRNSEVLTSRAKLYLFSTF